VSATAWVNDVIGAIRTYSRRRRTAPPVVQVTLLNGESRYVLSMSAGENDELVSLDVYPENGADDLLDVEGSAEHGDVEGERMTREVLVVHPRAVQKVELLHEHPGQQPFGFVAEPEADEKE
jgi:hypothetical protein